MTSKTTTAGSDADRQAVLDVLARGPGVGSRRCRGMSLRGARAAGAVTTTSARRGVIADEPARRDEWLRVLSAIPG